MKGNYTRLKITGKTKPVRQREKSEIRTRAVALCTQAHVQMQADSWGVHIYLEKLTRGVSSKFSSL